MRKINSKKKPDVYEEFKHEGNTAVLIITNLGVTMSVGFSLIDIVALQKGKKKYQYSWQLF